MALIVNNLAFEGSKKGTRSVAAKMSSGTLTLQKLAGKDETVVADYIPVADGALTADGEFTFHAPPDQTFRIVLTGDASGNLSQ